MHSFKFIEKLQKKEHAELVFTGDSITQRCYHTHGYPGYAGLFYDKLREKFQTYDLFMFNTGRSGSNTFDLLQRIDRDVIRFAPDFAAVMIGMNDAAEGEAGLPGFSERLTAIVQKITGAGIEFMLMTPNCLPPILRESRSVACRAALPAYADAIRTVAKAHGVPLCDVYEEFERKLNADYDAYWTLLDDPVHPNESGHRVIAGLLCAAINI